MPEGEGGYQPSEEEINSAEEHMTQQEKRDSVDRARKKERNAEHADEDGEILAEDIKKLVNGGEWTTTDSGKTHFDKRMDTTEALYGPESPHITGDKIDDYLLRVAKAAGLSNTDLQSGVLGEKDGWRIKVKIDSDTGLCDTLAEKIEE